MKPELKPYQKTGSSFLASRNRAALFDDPGLGKSAQSLVAAKAVGCSKLLVICPASVKNVWLHEAQKWGYSGELVVKSYDGD